MTPRLLIDPVCRLIISAFAFPRVTSIHTFNFKTPLLVHPHAHANGAVARGNVNFAIFIVFAGAYFENPALGIIEARRYDCLSFENPRSNLFAAFGRLCNYPFA
jgi:hypothetical protein